MLAWHGAVDRRVDWLGELLITALSAFIVFVPSDGSTALNEAKTGCKCTSRVSS